jgi:2-keto-4-pentenoate hydratase/2-oxohepta-3-ene-1,7-dioic acid hydratase in catechol pathway
MRIANYEGRLVVVAGGVGHEVAHDVEKNSGGRFGPEPQAIYEDWDAFTGWAAGARWEGGAPVRPDGLGSPAPAPRQVFGIGLNYRDHAAESGLPVPAGERRCSPSSPAASPDRTVTSSCRRAVTSTGRSSWWPSSAATPAMSRPNGRWNTWPVTPSARTYPNGCYS